MKRALHKDERVTRSIRKAFHGDCAICFESLTDTTDDDLQTACSGRHCFHLRCLSTWLRRNSTCPTCREEVPSHLLPIETQFKRIKNGVYLAMVRNDPDRIRQFLHNFHFSGEASSLYDIALDGGKMCSFAIDCDLKEVDPTTRRLIPASCATYVRDIMRNVMLYAMVATNWRMVRLFFENTAHTSEDGQTLRFYQFLFPGHKTLLETFQQFLLSDCAFHLLSQTQDNNLDASDIQDIEYKPMDCTTMVDLGHVLMTEPAIPGFIGSHDECAVKNIAKFMEIGMYETMNESASENSIKRFADTMCRAVQKAQVKCNFQIDVRPRLKEILSSAADIQMGGEFTLGVLHGVDQVKLLNYRTALFIKRVLVRVLDTRSEKHAFQKEILDAIQVGRTRLLCSSPANAAYTARLARNIQDVEAFALVLQVWGIETKLETPQHDGLLHLDTL